MVLGLRQENKNKVAGKNKSPLKLYLPFDFIDKSTRQDNLIKVSHWFDQ